MRNGVRIALIVSAAVTAGCPVTQPQDTPVSHKTFRDQITDTKYYLYVPSTYDKNRTYPLVITLHGTNPWDTAWMQIREWKALAEKKQFIVAAPCLRHASTQGIFPVPLDQRLSALAKDEEAILAICEEICNRYRVNRKKILLTGFSAGGFPMYYVGLHHPETFSVLIARACNSDVRILERVGVAPNTPRVPVVIFYGKDDLAPIQKQSIATFQWLRRHGWNKHNSRWKETRGGHLRRPETSYTYWVEYVGE